MKTDCYPPGPWRVDDLGDACFVETNHRWGIGADSKPTYRIAKIEGLGSDAEATARLIAAAPELLLALREIVEHRDTFADGASKLWTQAGAAIKKATGG